MAEEKILVVDDSPTELQHDGRTAHKPGIPGHYGNQWH